jgi:S1-C subfamily serine protease
MRQFVSYGPALVVLLTAGAALLVVPAAISRVTGAAASQRVTLARAELDSDSILERINAATRNVADSVEPSVVHIDVGRWSRSSGSGWIFDDLGHIVTNAHVVGSQQSVSVQLHDGRVLRGEVVASDPLADIAVIKVEEQAPRANACGRAIVCLRLARPLATSSA